MKPRRLGDEVDGLMDAAIRRLRRLGRRTATRTNVVRALRPTLVKLARLERRERGGRR